MKNPKTVIFCFSYGGVFKETNMGLVRDCSQAALEAAVSRERDRLCAVAWGRGCDIRDQAAATNLWDITLADPPEDALIDRARSNAAVFFLEKTDAEVMIQIDHDLIWRGPEVNYEGDLLHLARKCAETKGVVGACVSKKCEGQGIASMFKEATECTIPSPNIYPAWFIGAAFTAYHRDVVKAVHDSLPPTVPVRPIFLPMVVQHPLDHSQMLHISEDWAFNHRMRALGIDRSYISTMPMVGHIGKKVYKVVGDACPRIETANQPIAPATMPKISCIHATRGRPESAAKARETWLSLASNPGAIEYIFSIDTDDKTGGVEKNICTTVIGNSRGNVDAYNRGFRKSTGDIIVQVHDDVVPPQNWDIEIVKRIDTSKSCVLRVSDGLGANVNGPKPWLIPIAIGSRKFFCRVGGVFYPEYISVFCDDDLGMKADKDGTSINCPELIFQHRWEGPDNDECKRRSYAAENWKHGEALLERRKAEGFPDAC